MKLVKNGRVIESAPVVLSLLKDTSWCYAWCWVGTIAIVPVITFQIYEVWKKRKDYHEVIKGTLATLALLANGTWMIGDLYFGSDHFRGVAKWFFSFGIGLILAYYAFLFRKEREVPKPKGYLVVSRHLSSRLSFQRRHRVLIAMRRSHGNGTR